MASLSLEGEVQGKAQTKGLGEKPFSILGTLTTLFDGLFFMPICIKHET